MDVYSSTTVIEVDFVGGATLLIDAQFLTGNTFIILKVGVDCSSLPLFILFWWSIFIKWWGLRVVK